RKWCRRRGSASSRVWRSSKGAPRFADGSSASFPIARGPAAPGRPARSLSRRWAPKPTASPPSIPPGCGRPLIPTGRATGRRRRADDLPRVRRVGDRVPRGSALARGPHAIRAPPRVLHLVRRLPAADARHAPRRRPTARERRARECEGEAAARLPAMEARHPVIAYKFLRVGAVGPFTGHRWSPGTWVDAADVHEGLGVHACRVSDLAFWIGEELWRVELQGHVWERATQIEAARGRLLDRVAGWDGKARTEFGLHCVFQARDIAAAALRGLGFADLAHRLALPGMLPELAA